MLHLDDCSNHWRNLGKGSAIAAECGCADLPLRDRVELLLRRRASSDALDVAEARLESMSLFPEVAAVYLDLAA